MIITNVEEKKDLLEKFYGKFYTESIEDIDYNAYLKLMRNIDFIKSYDNYILVVERPHINYYTTIYCNPTKTDFNKPITEEEYIEYHLKQLETYSTDFWITQGEHKISFLTKERTPKSLRKVSILELKEINELFEKYKMIIVKALKSLFAKNQALITRYAIWEDKS